MFAHLSSIKARQNGGLYFKQLNLLLPTVEMARFLSIMSLVLFLYATLVSAAEINRINGRRRSGSNDNCANGSGAS